MYYVCAAITLISSSISLFFSLLAVIKSKDDTKIKALYVTARSVAFFAIALFPFFIVLKELVVITAIGMIIVQFFDGFIGIKIRDVMYTIGPFITAIVHLIVLITFLL